RGGVVGSGCCHGGHGGGGCVVSGVGGGIVVEVVAGVSGCGYGGSGGDGVGSGVVLVVCTGYCGSGAVVVMVAAWSEDGSGGGGVGWWQRGSAVDATAAATAVERQRLLPWWWLPWRGYGDGKMAGRNMAAGVVVLAVVRRRLPEKWRHVTESDVGDRIDRVIRIILGSPEKAHRKSFPATGGGWPAVGRNNGEE
nr:hypothetical protein [Tanacetum cinerariifolium]